MYILWNKVTPDNHWILQCSEQEVINIKSSKNDYQYNAILKEIKYLRGMSDFIIDRRNSNRYRIMVKESVGNTAYCFSTPIYNIKTKTLVQTNFTTNKTGAVFKGTNGLISVNQNHCIFENYDGRCTITMSEVPEIYKKDTASKSNVIITPTLCGLRFTVKGNRFQLQLRSEAKQDSIRYNSLCFSVMKEKFKPFLSVASLYARDEKNKVLPVEIKYLDKGNQTYDISLFHSGKNGSLIFEVNLYEPKLFQDTTVGSAHPDVNNAYGAVGFIGKTKEFGEQWLYSRPDFSKIPDIVSERIEKVLLHIPILNGSSENVDVYIPEKRFCSFGSTWNKKINASPKITVSNNNCRYLTVDVTTIFVNRTDRTLVYNEGLILKKPKGKNDFIAISTGDCYSAPQILEIRLKN